MIEADDGTDPELVRAKIITETAKIPWTNLQRFFASGKTLFVSKELDLIDVAYAFQQDNSDTVGRWVNSEQIKAVSIEQAKQWVAEDSLVWAAVVKPWVLVQNPD
ncbi:MAG: DUF2288 domain-containing protein [Gammaproteobacteria bacterium]|nr:DUF2288 domain-containing protein [Gammaproteobacteria bacterium]